MRQHHLHGFTLIELMITLVVLGILIALGLPSYSGWITNTQVRVLAESLQNGLRLAQREAAMRNGSVVFSLTKITTPACASTAATDGTNWTVCAGGAAVQTGVSAAGGEMTTVASDFSSVTFNGLGRTNLANSSKIDVGSSKGVCDSGSGGVRCLRILLSTAGKVRMCDPQLPAGDPAACS